MGQRLNKSMNNETIVSILRPVLEQFGSQISLTNQFCAEILASGPFGGFLMQLRTDFCVT